MQKNTGNREILTNNGDVAEFPEVFCGTAKDTVCLQPKAQLKLLEGWSVDPVWLKRHPKISSYPVMTPAKATAPVTVETKKTGVK